MSYSPREAKVTKFQGMIRIDQQVLGLYITMNNVVLMAKINRAAELINVASYQIAWQAVGLLLQYL